MQTIIVDADIMVYRAAFASERAVDFDGHGQYQVFADMNEAVGRLESDLELYRQAVGDGAWVLALTDQDTPNFRKAVYPEYKCDRRKSGRRPLLFDALRTHLCDNFSVVMYPSLEADDVLGILATELDDAVMVSCDKDLLTVPGRLYNPNRCELTETDVATADLRHLAQTLAGDAVDHYPGCPGIGPKKAAKILGGWPEVVSAYEAKELTEDDALAQARCAYILRAGDYDRTTGEVTLWTP